MKQKDAYQLALEIFHKGEYDAEKICLSLAQQRPAIFVEMHQQDFQDPKTGRLTVAGKTLTVQQSDAIRQHVLNGQKIYAIKELRGFTGLGLKESKIFVEELEQSLEGVGYALEA